MGLIKHEVLPVFQVNIFMISASSKEELLELWGAVEFQGKYELPARIIDAFDDSAQFASLFDAGDTYDIIYVRNELMDHVEDIFTIAVHESYHIMNFIFRIIRHVPNIENDEMEAYYLETIYKTIKNFLKESCDGTEN